jgi:hypothetical protein
MPPAPNSISSECVPIANTFIKFIDVDNLKLIRKTGYYAKILSIFK